MIKILLASHNRGKLNEFRTMLEGRPLVVLSPDQVGLKADAEETGSSFDENALIKARALRAWTGGWIMADDSGLCVAGLNGAPGIYSARYGGPPYSDEANINRLLLEMEGLIGEERKAAFCCSLAVIRADGTEKIYHGKTEGTIAPTPSGTKGFGYDPVFIPLGETRTMADLDPEEKNAISHRGRALNLFLEELAGHEG